MLLRQITLATSISIFLALATAAQEQRLMMPDADVSVSDAVPHAGLTVTTPTRTPPLMRFAGMLRDYMGRPMSGVHGVSIAIYKEQHGGSPIFLETQLVAFDDHGRFTALLGAASERGLTPELFTTGEPRWLGVQLQLPGYEEQPRTLLVAVPYALKALDADTLGGRPASAYALAGTVASEPGAAVSVPIPAIRAPHLPPPLLAQTMNYVQKYNATGPLTDSLIFDNGVNIGIGTTNPHAASKLDVVGLIDAAQFRIKDNGDNVISALQGSNFYHLIGTYSGWDPAAMYLAGYNNTNLAGIATNKVIVGGPGSDLTFSVTGNVGIGIPNPAERLELAPDGNVLIKTFPPNDSTQGLVSYGLSARAAGGLTNTWRLFTSPVGGGWGVPANSFSVWQYPPGGGSYCCHPRFTILPGTSTQAIPTLTLDSIGNLLSDFYAIRNSGNTTFMGGNVGVGTATPAQKLDVAGNIKISGPLTNGIVFADGTVQTTAAGSLAFGTGKTLVASEESGKDAHAALRAEIDQLRAEIQQLRALLDQERSGRAQR